MKRFYKRSIKPVIDGEYSKFILFGIVIIIFGLLEKVIPSKLHTAVISTTFYSLAGLGFALLLGYGGLASLGTGAFMGVGLFGLHYFYRYAGMPLLIAIAIVMVLALVVAISFGFVSLRISGMYLAIVTMALSSIVIEIIKNVKVYASGTTGGFLSNGPYRPLKIFGLPINIEMASVIAGLFIIIGLIIVYNLMRSATGRALLAIKNSESAAQTMGISLVKYRLFAFIISGILASLAGVLSMLYFKGGNVDSIGVVFALNVLAAVIVGGTKSVWGIILGTFVVFGLDLAIFQRFNLGNYSIILNGVLITVIVMFYPNGLIQLFTDVKVWYKKFMKKLEVKKYGTDE